MRYLVEYPWWKGLLARCLGRWVSHRGTRGWHIVGHYWRGNFYVRYLERME